MPRALTPIRLQDVLDGFHKLHILQAYWGIFGELGIPAEFTPIPDAPSQRHLLLPIWGYLNSIFQAGTAPTDVTEGLITPISRRETRLAHKLLFLVFVIQAHRNDRPSNAVVPYMM